MHFHAYQFRPRFGRNETAGLLRPDSGSSAVSQVRSVLPNPFETKRNFEAYWGCVGVCDMKLAEAVGFEPTVEFPPR